VDTELFGHHIKAGEMPFIGWAPADREESLVALTNDVNIEQGHKNRPLGFGLAVHLCLGSDLARRESAIVFEELHRRVPDYQIADSANPSGRWPPLVPCLDTPLVFDPVGR
jgi:cytochrome P450